MRNRTMGQILEMKDYKGKGTEHNPFEINAETLNKIYLHRFEDDIKLTLQQLINLNCLSTKREELIDYVDRIEYIMEQLDEPLELLYGKNPSKKNRKKKKEGRIAMEMILLSVKYDIVRWINAITDNMTDEWEEIKGLRE